MFQSKICSNGRIFNRTSFNPAWNLELIFGLQDKVTISITLGCGLIAQFGEVEKCPGRKYDGVKVINPNKTALIFSD